ncbi:unnamed protein product [Orchesella dallaii]|uniref:Uncharacterized protein n=1 Tax=Orchesella dallaii TaxID=48710 RepID=A0ABP1QI28_9HEXA
MNVLVSPPRSSESDVQIQNENDKLAFASWKDESVDKLNKSQFCLIDHPECWQTAGLSETLIRNNPRLIKLMNRKRNHIVELPDPTETAFQFYCADCNGIPFPWSPDPSTPLVQEDEVDEVVAQAVYLCQQGHPICRTCFGAVFSCGFDKIDYNIIFNQKRGTRRSTAPLVLRPHCLQSFSDTFGELEEGKDVCLMDRSIFKCMFLTKMIKKAEFACKHFYNWCAFRGSGSKLHKHEESCPYAIKQGIPDTFTVSSTSESNDQCENSDDSEILKLNFGDIVLEGHKMVNSVKEEHGNEIDLQRLQEQVYPFQEHLP